MRLKVMLLAVMVILLTKEIKAQVQVSMPDTTADWRGQVSIPIQITDVSNYDVYSYEFSITYDSLIIKALRVENQGTLTANWAAPIVNDATKGKLIFGGYGVNKLTGKGRLVNIVFEVIGNPNDITQLTFSYSLFNNGTPTATKVNGRLKIVTNLVPVTITANVLEGITLVVDGASHSVPYATYWAIGSQHQISAPSPQTFNGTKRYVFQSWSDQGAQTHTVAVTGATTFTALYGIQYYLSVLSSHGNPQGTGWYNAGTTAYFSVDSLVTEGTTTRYKFSSWSGSGAGSYSGATRKASAVINGPITETANWSTQYHVDIVSAYGKPFGSGWYLPGTVINFGIDSTIINRTNSRYKFLSWSGTGTGSYTGTNAKSSITVNNPIVEHANWDVEFFLVAASYPEGILQVPGTGWYKQGHQFTSIKAPDSLISNQIKYDFRYWKVNDQAMSGNPITVLINEPKTVTADYSSDITVVITTNIGQGTKVLVDGEEKNVPYTAQWVKGSRHNIGIASIQQGSSGTRYVYRRWNHGGNQIQDVIPTSNITYTAMLETQFYLEVKTEPPGIVNPVGSGWYTARQTVELDSLPQNQIIGSTSIRLIKWQLDGVDSTKASIFVFMDKPHTAIAVYQQGFYIAGSITFVGALPVPVCLNVAGKENFTTQSLSDGSYLIAGLLPGDYLVALSHPDFSFQPLNRSYHLTTNEEYQYYVAFYQPSSIVPGENVNFVPLHYSLAQNYPNPFVGGTVIEYELPHDEQVNLAVYNVLGQVIKQLVHSRQNSGRYRIVWNRLDFRETRVQPGVYFYRIEAGNFVQIRKMIIL